MLPRTATTPPFDLAGIRRRIRRLDDLTRKFSVEALHVVQQRTGLKSVETTAYAAALIQCVALLTDATAALKEAEGRLAAVDFRGPTPTRRG